MPFSIASENLIESHPCYSHKAHYRVGRIHLPVAKKCNIKCNYCDKRVTEYYHTSRPGLSSKLLTPDEAMICMGEAIESNPSIAIAAIAGPGEPLFNKETYKTFELVSERFPWLDLCICTNGLLLTEKIYELKEIGVKYITITINAIAPVIEAKINRYIIKNGKKIEGVNASKILIESQLEGVEIAASIGIPVKINTVLIPDINIEHIRAVASELKKRGAHIMNMMSLIPMGEFRSKRPPTCKELNLARDLCEPIIPQFRLCKQCRADACGIPGLDG